MFNHYIKLFLQSTGGVAINAQDKTSPADRLLIHWNPWKQTTCMMFIYWENLTFIVKATPVTLL